MSVQKKARRRALPLVAVVFLVTALAGAGWAASAYVTLVRLHVGVVDGCDRVDAAGNAHLALVDNLLLLPGFLGSHERGELAAVRGLRERAGRVVFGPATLEDAARFGEFRAAHVDLAAAIEAFLQPADELSSDLRRAQSRLLGDLDAVDRKMQTYRSAALRFPGSLVAVYATADGLPGETPIGGL